MWTSLLQGSRRTFSGMNKTEKNFQVQFAKKASNLRKITKFPENATNVVKFKVEFK